MEREQLNGQTQEKPFYVDPSRVGRGTIFYVHTEFEGVKGKMPRLIVRNIIEEDGRRVFFLTEIPHPHIELDDKHEPVYEIPEANLVGGQHGILVFDEALNLQKGPAAVAFSSSK